MWKPYLDAIAAVLPADVSIDAFSVDAAATPMAAAPPRRPTRCTEPGVATIQFTARATTLPDTRRGPTR